MEIIFFLAGILLVVVSIITPLITQTQFNTRDEQSRKVSFNILIVQTLALPVLAGSCFFMAFEPVEDTIKDLNHFWNIFFILLGANFLYHWYCFLEYN